MTPSESDGSATGENGSKAGLRAGTVVGDRYRIIERLGKGSMGEVYRAEDLRIGQDVALKFLSGCGPSSGADHDALLNEIRIARRVTHPNVCRLHDLGEIDGLPFVSMEYIRGEDLHALLQRVGAPQADKAVQMARQICSGLQAAHEQGVLHRDLKPANVLVDSRGNVRITDFGIAAAEDRADDTPAGSPAYMAPELFAGGSASTASDVFSLGLVLYELFTGRRLYDADSMTTLLEMHRRPIEPPSAHAPQIDRRVEAVIEACLRRDPESRPSSAIEVLARLPGGDPLAEAIASGQTPSPALVAATTATARLSLQRGGIIATLAIAVFVLAALIDPSVKLLARTDLPLSDSVLVHRAEAHLRALGYDHDIEVEAHGFELHEPVLERLADQQLDADAWESSLRADRNPVISFWYRAATHAGALAATNVKGRVRWNDPKHALPGMARLELDPRGRLVYFSAKPSLSESDQVGGPVGAIEDPAASVPGAGGRPYPIDDPALFALAGLDFGAFQPVDPIRRPDSFADERQAFQGTIDEIRIRVEIARLEGHPVFFEIVDDDPYARRPAETNPPSFLFFARVLILIVAALLAWSGMRRRRVDVQGATRIAIAMFGLVSAFTVLTGDHGGTWGGVGNLALAGMSHGLAIAIELAVYYLAVEPHARRIWPQTLVSWSKLLSGRIIDPDVAGSILAGVCVGCVSAVMYFTTPLLQRAFDLPEVRPFAFYDRDLELLAGTGPALGVFFEIVVDVSRESLMMFVALVLGKKLLRKEFLAAIAVALCWTVVLGPRPSGEGTMRILEWGTSFAVALLVVFAAIRFGLLALVAGYLTAVLMRSYPIRPDVGVWYSTVTLLPSIALAILVGGALWTLKRGAAQAGTRWNLSG